MADISLTTQTDVLKTIKIESDSDNGFTFGELLEFFTGVSQSEAKEFAEADVVMASEFRLVFKIKETKVVNA